MQKSKNPDRLWILKEKIEDPKEREIIMLMLSSAGYEIYPGTRDMINIVDFPYLIHYQKNNVASSTSDNCKGLPQLTIEELKKFLKKRIKNRKI